jgi:hypothetical protein
MSGELRKETNIDRQLWKLFTYATNVLKNVVGSKKSGLLVAD